MAANTYGRQVTEVLTNKSGGSVAAGDVVVVDSTNNEAFTTSTAGAVTGTIGIAQEAIANNASGRVLTSGYAALVNVNASVTRGNFGKTHTVAKQATDAGSSRVVGAFCQFLTGGTTPSAHVFGLADAAGAGSASLTHTTQGTTSAGASFKTRGVILKKLTLASAGLVSSIHVFCKGDGSNNVAALPIIFSDSSGSPANIIFMPAPNLTSVPGRVFAALMNTTVRDLALPCGVWLAAGDYWFGVYASDNTASALNVAYTASGGTGAYVAGSTYNEPGDASVHTLTTNSEDYSIYIDVLR